MKLLRSFHILLVAVISLLPLSARAGTLTGTFSTIPTGTAVNLTAQGTTDWVHWGLITEMSIDRKVNVAPQISDFTPVEASNGYVYTYQYAGNLNGYSWSDGTPNIAVTNTQTGVWAYGVPAVGSGFRFQVTASTNVKTLKIYVGAYAARGRLRVYLSDNSAAGYTNSTAINNTGNGPSGVFTVSFAANSPNQTLHVVWTLDQLRGAGGDGNVTLQAAALSAPGVNNLPFVALTEPRDRASYSPTNEIALRATAGDADGTVNVVQFYAGTNKIGEATGAPYSAVWTNPQPGSYVLTARAIDNNGGVGISSPVTVFVSGTGGTLSGTRSNSPLSANLTLEGTADWAHWGSLTASSFDHKATGGSQISNFTLIGSNVVQRYDENFTAFSWSDGVPLAATNGSTTGIYVSGEANGFKISAPADTTRRTLRIYTGLYGAQANFEAFLTDFSGRAFTDITLSNVFGDRSVVYTIDYAAASAGQRLIVRQTIGNVYDFTYGNVNLQAVTLQESQTPDTNFPPVVAITAPANGAVFMELANFLLESSASDSDGSITQVEFFNGITSIGVDTNSPYSVNIVSLPAGSYTFSAVATDNEGSKATNAVTITVNSAPLNNPPTVVITNPPSGAVFTAPASFTVEAEASDTDGTVTQVEFLNGAASLGVDTNSPYSANVTNLIAGSYIFSAVATDYQGARFTNSITITVNNPVNNPPTIAITNPASGVILTAPATFELQAMASDSDGTITQVEFFNGTISLGVDTSSPYSATMNDLAAGNYTLSAVATDDRGGAATNSINIVVNASPTVAITTPTNGASFVAPASISITATAADTDGTVTNVSFLEGGTNIGEATTNPYNFTWTNVAAGTYTLTVRGTDDRGSTSISAPITISVTNAPLQPVTIIAPTVSGTTLSLTFATEAGRTYTVEHAEAIPSTDWQILTNIAGTGSNVMAFNTTTNAPQQFYRVITQ